MGELEFGNVFCIVLVTWPKFVHKFLILASTLNKYLYFIGEEAGWGQVSCPGVPHLSMNIISEMSPGLSVCGLFLVPGASQRAIWSVLSVDA